MADTIKIPILKMRKLRFTEIKPFNEASIAGELQLSKYVKKSKQLSIAGSRPNTNNWVLVLVEGGPELTVRSWYSPVKQLHGTSTSHKASL